MDGVMASAPLGHIRFEMLAGRGRKARAVEQEALPDRQGGQLEVTCLIACEVNAPAGTKPVVWRLLTNRVAPTLQDAVELINGYHARWEIKLFSWCSRRAAVSSGVHPEQKARARQTVV